MRASDRLSSALARKLAERWADFVTGGTAHSLSQVAALAEAMRAAGYRRFATPEAVAAELRRALRFSVSDKK
jgi:hypothetical protein